MYESWLHFPLWWLCVDLQQEVYLCLLKGILEQNIKGATLTQKHQEKTGCFVDLDEIILFNE